MSPPTTTAAAAAIGWPGGHQGPGRLQLHRWVRAPRTDRWYGTVTVSFVTGHPKNNLHRNGTFLEVQGLNGGQWQRVADDGDWDTTYRWTRTGLADSKATITWKAAGPGTYRIVHRGDSKALNGTITPFTGTSRTFTVTQ